VVEQRVGRRGDGDRRLGEGDGLGMLTTPRQRLGTHSTPRDRRLQIVTCERLAFVRERLRLDGSSLTQQCARQQRAGPSGIDAEPEVAETVVSGTQRALGRDHVAFEQIDPSRKNVGLEQAVRDAKLLDHMP